MCNKKRIGLFFGSFNPVHIGHLAIANCAVVFGDFAEVWLVVSPHNPLKPKNLLADVEHRIAMAQIALKNLNLPVKVCDIEMRLPQPSYTINTLETLTAENGDCEFCIIMGADSMACIEQWSNYRQILSDYGIYVYPRLGYDLQMLCNKYKVEPVNAPIIEVSSTFIRENIGRGNNMNAFISPATGKYIIENKLYKNTTLYEL
ncbi:MAG: nicotinate-nucleotide adenylyltransferase [Prevotellaceae bacterium]|jgi:nicotinate-nucleotide adenylyltransferase|nr:nicotinate-nucleotide adenylyltransferase [Prevotellaceae bacterium]